MHRNSYNNTPTGFGQPSRFQGRSGPPPQDEVQQQRPRKKHPKFIRSTKRMEGFRKDMSHKNEAVYQEDLKKLLFVGTHGEEDALARLGEAQQLRAITLSITTRSIGFGIAQTMFTAITINENILPPPCYSLYRIFLAMLEAKLEGLKTDYPLVSRDTARTFQYISNPRLQHLAHTVTVAPTPIAKAISAVGLIKRDGIVYIPAVMEDAYSRDEMFVPRPETVLYSNLRRIVLALSNPATPERVRTYFENHNPIPGAIFEDHILQNPDEIMPENYGYDDLQREIRMIQPFLIKLQKHAPKLVSGCVDFKSAGKQSLFISNELENLRLPSRRRNQSLQEWYADCLPLGNITTYFARFDLPAAERFEGQINLFGELPDKGNLRWPFYSNRDPSVCPFEIASDYHGIHQIMYG